MICQARVIGQATRPRFSDGEYFRGSAFEYGIHARAAHIKRQSRRIKIDMLSRTETDLGAAQYVPPPVVIKNRPKRPDPSAARRQDHHHLTAFQLWLGFDLRNLAGLLANAIEQLHSEFLVSHFATTKP